jgi:hypothetical protein
VKEENINKVKIPSEFILDCMKSKQINLVHVFIAHKVLSRTHLNIHRKELTTFLKTKYSYPHINQMLKIWQNKPFVDYDNNNDTYRFKKNVEDYYKNLYIPHNYKRVLKFSLNELTYTGNTLARFLYCEVMFRYNCSMTREFITEITGLSKPTQIKAEKEFNVTVTPQYIEMNTKLYNFEKIARKCLLIDNKHYLQHTNHYSYINQLGKVRKVKRENSKLRTIYNKKIQDTVFCFVKEMNGIKKLVTGELYNHDYMLSFS